MKILTNIDDDIYNWITSHNEGVTFLPITLKLYDGIRNGEPFPEDYKNSDTENLTEKEKEFLTLLFKIGKEIVESDGGVFNTFSVNSFDRNDLFNLSEKLGIDY